MESRMLQLISWLRPVAMAAPAMPRRNPKMSSGSSTMFRMPPVVRPIMASEALPSNRRMLFMVKLLAIKGEASKM